jgi:hypothetical protein
MRRQLPDHERRNTTTGLDHILHTTLTAAGPRHHMQPRPTGQRHREHRPRLGTTHRRQQPLHRIHAGPERLRSTLHPGHPVQIRRPEQLATHHRSAVDQRPRIPLDHHSRHARHLSQPDANPPAVPQSRKQRCDQPAQPRPPAPLIPGKHSGPTVIAAEPPRLLRRPSSCQRGGPSPGPCPTSRAGTLCGPGSFAKILCGGRRPAVPRGGRPPPSACGAAFRSCAAVAVQRFLAVKDVYHRPPVCGPWTLCRVVHLGILEAFNLPFSPFARILRGGRRPAVSRGGRPPPSAIRHCKT